MGYIIIMNATETNLYHCVTVTFGHQLENNFYQDDLVWFLLGCHWCDETKLTLFRSLNATTATTKKSSKRCVLIHSPIASQSSLQVRAPAPPLQPRCNLYLVTSHGQKMSQKLLGILLCSSVAFQMTLLTLPSPFMVVTATTAYSAPLDTWRTSPR